MRIENSDMSVKSLLGNTDIYLIDQILKERYQQGAKILDAGCGKGRNLHWFYQHSFSIFGLDNNEERIAHVKQVYSNSVSHFELGDLATMPYKDQQFDHVICSAVLHFAKNEKQFEEMFSELIRVLRSKGTLFIRTASDMGIRSNFDHLGNGVYRLNDGTDRFLLSKSLLEKIVDKHQLSFLELLKTSNVDDLRCMTTLVLQKN